MAKITKLETAMSTIVDSDRAIMKEGPDKGWNVNSRSYYKQQDIEMDEEFQLMYIDCR